MMVSVKEAILASGRRVEKVKIEGIGEVPIRHLTIEEVLQFSEIENKQAGTRQLVAMAVMDEAGEPVFDTPDAVMQVDWQVVKRLADAVAKVNNLEKDESKNGGPSAD